MKKIFIVAFLFAILSNVRVRGFGYGIPKSNDNEVPYLGKKIDELIRSHNSFYICDSSKNEIYLTFDTGYELGNTTLILDTLKNTNTKAAFFITGGFLKTNHDLVKRMVDEGHLVCNHTLNHPDVTKLSKEKLKYELEELEKEFYELTNHQMAKYLRPPEGTLTEESLKITDDLGYTQIFWSLTYVDWRVNEQKGKEYAYNTVISRIHNGAIILLHTVSKDNALALEDIINELKKSYEFKTLDDLIIQI